MRSLAIGLLALTAAAQAVAAGFDVAAFGSFKRMSHTGDTAGQVKLADLPQAAGNWGVGALARLEGEVLLYDGRLLISRGDDPEGRAFAAQAGDEAVLFASARVQRWVEVVLPSHMTQARLESFVLEQARERGLDVEAPFPFLLQGKYPKLAWHVFAGQAPAMRGSAAHAKQHASKRGFEQSDAGGTLVGIYSGVRLEGVVSHPGERFHLHYVDDALGKSGHVDSYMAAGGSVLKLPMK